MESNEKSRVEPELRKRIQELIALQAGQTGANPDLVEDIIVNALKLLTDVKDRGDARVIRTALGELRYAFRLFAPYEATRKVTIFGSARTVPSKQEYREAVEFARQIAEAGYMVITGAGPGIMQAGHEGAGPEKSFGVNIRLPWEQAANPIIDKDAKLVSFKYFFTRKLTFVRHSDAIVLFPGGFGTMDECYEALTLMQTGKARLVPLVLLDRAGGTYWKAWDKNVREHLLRAELIAAEDLYLYQVATSAAHAVRIITRFYRNYHSSRFVRDLLVMRVKNVPPASAMAGLNDDFGDIISGEKIHAIEPTPDEREDNDHLELGRIAFGFDRRSYGRLRQLIDVLNSF
jgi:uncharacterized protein (TIGR00730 family)